ncbi:hypothetical protein [Pseudomonas lundensis]|uniref:hypothetical protein n=1 Tax=Pseudomonas lundensis TaxID=86185 RepID=UPI00089DCB3B|nr:hypothetical protein [Pseudomonas lundensis]
MRFSPNTKLCQQHRPGGLWVGWNPLRHDQRFGFLARVLQLDLFTRPSAVVANAVSDTPFQRLAGLRTAHNDCVIAFEALAQGFVVVCG